MRKYLIMVSALAALIAVSVAGIASAGGEKPVTVRAGNLVFTFNGGFSPKKLPKKKEAPITLNASGKIKTADGTHPPALKEAYVETDKNGSVFVKGLPTCKAGQLQATETKVAEKNCKKALIGKGNTVAEVAFPEQRPITIPSKLLVFNGGQKGGKITFYIHAYFSAPVSGAIVTTVTIKKIHKGRYGLLSIAKIPKIAGGSGSVRSFNLTINRKYRYKGRKVSVLTARCTDGKLQAKAKAIFHDYNTGQNTSASAGIVRTCTPKG